MDVKARDTGDFSVLVLMAAREDIGWRDVLIAAISATGAKSGVIAAREIETAEFSFPHDAATQLTAPLIVGIAPDHVDTYFGQYAAIDVWTNIERLHHPHEPYFMSDRLPLAELRTTEFFSGWLQPQGICECFVAEVYRCDGHWVALNLLFDETTLNRRSEIVARMAELLPPMRMGWDLSERLVSLSIGQTASRGYLEAVPVPCLILNANLVVVSANAIGLQDINRHVPLTAPVTINAPLALEACDLLSSLDTMRQSRDLSPTHGKTTVASRLAGYTLQVSLLAKHEDVLGNRHAHFMIVIRKEHRSAVRAPRIWVRKELTEMQSAMVRWIAEGGKVPDFALKKGIAKKTAYDHLFAARQKLDGISARDIYMNHQALLMLEG